MTRDKIQGAVATKTGIVSARREQDFGLPLEATVLSQVKLTSVASAIPGEWANDTTWKSDVIFLFRDVDGPNILQPFGCRPGIETSIYTPVQCS